MPFVELNWFRRQNSRRKRAVKIQIEWTILTHPGCYHHFMRFRYQYSCDYTFSYLIF